MIYRGLLSAFPVNINYSNAEKESDVAGKTLYSSEKQIADFCNASFSVEGSLVFPIFFFAIMVFLYFFTVEAINMNIFREGVTLARSVSESCIAEKMSKGVRSKISSVASEKLGLSDENSEKLSEELTTKGAELTAEIYLNSVLTGYGSLLKGISCDETGVTEDGLFYKVKLGADIRFPFEVFGVLDVGISHDYKLRLFNGRGRELMGVMETEGDDAEGNATVFVTETGTVYHSTRECTHLRLSIKAVEYSSVSFQRNEAGGRYYPCEICSKGLPGNIVYITKEGTRYHILASCSGIKRNVKEIPLEEAKEKYRPCSRCSLNERSDNG